MKKRTAFSALVLCLCLALSIAAQAKEIPIYSDITGKRQYAIGSDDFTVKFNGEKVDFPDAQPFVDEHDRTLVPLRFVTEKMGAAVTWDENSSTATVEKDGTRVDVTIGSNNITVTKNGEASTVLMDTKAVLKDDRTFVPVRFVAEALGAWVGYSDLFNTAQIYDDVLTPKEITRLHSYPDQTWEEHLKLTGEKSYGVTNESWEKSFPQIAYFTGTGENGFSNANEWTIEMPKGSVSDCIPTIKAESYTGVITKNSYKYGEQENIICNKIALAEAIYGTAVQLGEVNGKLRTDLSCVMASRHLSDGNLLVRGVLTMDVPADANVEVLSEKFGMVGLKAGEHYECDVELKIALTGGKMGAVSIKALGGVA